MKNLIGDPHGDLYFVGYADDAYDAAWTMNTDWKIGAVKYDGEVLTLYKNGNASTSTSKSLNTTVGNYVVGYRLQVFEFPWDYFHGNIAEVLVYSSSLSNANLSYVHSYLKAKYNL